MKKVLRITLITGLVLLLLYTFYWLWKKSQPKPTIYDIVTVEIGDIHTTSVATGSVEPRDEVLIKPQISGIISELRKEAGEYVQAGEIIAVLEVIPEMTQLNSAESRVRIAKINLEQVEQEYERQKHLYDKGVISREEMENSEASHKKAIEERDNAQDNLEIIRDGVSKSTQQRSTTQIRSTINGMILDVPVKVGNSVIETNNFNEGTTIASIANMNDLIFEGKVDETEVGLLKSGMPMNITIGALESQTFNAVLEYISPKGENESGAILFEIKAAVTIPDSVVIRAGYSANGEIVLEEVKEVLTLPEGVLVFENDSTFVYTALKEDVAPKDQEYEKKHVLTGLSDGIRVEIKQGVAEGDRIRGGHTSGLK